MTTNERLSQTLSASDVYLQLTRSERWGIADVLREDNLARANDLHLPVEPIDTLYTRYGKRVLDVAISLVALAVTIPVNALVAVVTFFDVGRPLLFRQKRLGMNGKTFTLYKFRNMRNTRDANGELLPARVRVTRCGRFWRKTSIDELLNFWSVLRGDMSIIGPRPLVPEYYNRFSARHAARMQVRPGIECPPRTRNTVISTYEDQFENDVWYVENISFLTDLRLAFGLVRMVFDRNLARTRGSANKGSFLGYDENGRVLSSMNITTDEILRSLRRIRSEKAA